MNLGLKQLRCFVVVAEELNFTAAARRLYISQQALSRMVQQLERDLEVRLLERTTRSVALTDAGRELLSSSRRIITTIDDAVSTVRRVDRGERFRTLRVDISSGGLQTGALVLRRLRQDQPDIEIHQVEKGVRQGLEALGEGRLDALFGLATHCPPHFRADLIRREQVVVGMAADHPLAQFDALPVEKLADYELLLPSDEAAGEWVEFVMLFCRQAGVTPRRWRGVTHGSVAHAEVLREGRCVVPTVAWTDPPADLAFRPLIQPAPTFAWSLMTASSKEDHPELEALKHAAQTVAEERGWLV
ncbi:LysR family transcriptional regulator [Flindersiella endophytica]